MESDRKWIVTKVDGRIASVSPDYGKTVEILTVIASQPPSSFLKTETYKVSTEDLLALSERTGWEDLLLFGTDFQKFVWKGLFDLTHTDRPAGSGPIISYSAFSESIGKASSVRCVAHAVGLNPVAVIIPCHLVVLKEAIDRLEALGIEDGLFQWDALPLLDSSVDYGEYAYGSDLKRELIHRAVCR